MSLKLNRRSFLQSLVALGASYVIPADATPAQIRKVWQEALAHPWHFEVNEWGTITEPDFVQNETWDDIFNICTGHLKTPDDVINEVNGCQPLINHFQHLADLEKDELSSDLETEPALGLLRQRHIRKIVKAIQDDPDDGWQDWIELEGMGGVQRFKEEIEDWLGLPADYDQSEWFPLNYGPQGQAKAFFESLDNDTLSTLGVVIIEGDHPGSTYYAAELRQSIKEANAAAEGLGLPFRFKPENS